MLNTILIQAADAGGNGWSSIIMIVLLILIFYFFMIRPQSQKQKKINDFRKKLEKGSRVMTASGVMGKIVKIDDNIVTLNIAPNVDIKIDINFIYESAESASDQAAAK